MVLNYSQGYNFQCNKCYHIIKVDDVLNIKILNENCRNCNSKKMSFDLTDKSYLEYLDIFKIEYTDTTYRNCQICDIKLQKYINITEDIMSITNEIQPFSLTTQYKQIKRNTKKNQMYQM